MRTGRQTRRSKFNPGKVAYLTHVLVCYSILWIQIGFVFPWPQIRASHWRHRPVLWNFIKLAFRGLVKVLQNWNPCNWNFFNMTIKGHILDIISENYYYKAGIGAVYILWNYKKCSARGEMHSLYSETGPANEPPAWPWLQKQRQSWQAYSGLWEMTNQSTLGLFRGGGPIKRGELKQSVQTEFE